MSCNNVGGPEPKRKRRCNVKHLLNRWSEGVQESLSEQEWIITQPTAQPLPQAYIKEGHSELIKHNHFGVIRMDQRGSQLMQNHWCGRGGDSCNVLAANALTYCRFANWPRWQRGHPVGFLWPQEIRTPLWGCNSDSRRGIPQTVEGWGPRWLGRVWRTAKGPWRFYVRPSETKPGERRAEEETRIHH